MKEPVSPIISAPEAKDLLGHPDVLFVDARGGADAYMRYAAGHVLLAVFLDLETDLSKKGFDAARGGRHPLPDPEAFGLLLGEMGIRPATRVLVYDDKAGANAAARFWWMLRAAGHDNVQVVDGGLAALAHAAMPVTTGASPTREPGAPYSVTGWGLPMTDMEAVDKARTDPYHLIIDVRENYRYRGENEPIDPIAGHIPGAVNMPYTMNLDKNGLFRAPEVLAEQFRQLTGSQAQRNVVVHCGSGVTACHTALAMQMANLPIPTLYVGSWSEWSRNPMPVSTGEKP